MRRRRTLDPYSPEGIEAKLSDDEAERVRREKKEVKVCPICGRRPEYPPEKAGRHIYALHCEKCQARLTIHVIA